MNKINTRPYCIACCCCVQFFATPRILTCQAPLSMGFSKQEYWSGLPFPSSGDFPDPGIEPSSLIMEKNLKKNTHTHTHIYVYVQLNHFPVHQKLKQHCKRIALWFYPWKTQAKKTLKNPLHFYLFPDESWHIWSPRWSSLYSSWSGTLWAMSTLHFSQATCCFVTEVN